MTRWEAVGKVAGRPGRRVAERPRGQGSSRSIFLVYSDGENTNHLAMSLMDDRSDSDAPAFRRPAPSRAALNRASETRFGATLNEIAQEKAASLGRAGRRLELALEKLRDHEGSSAGAADVRARLLDEAGEALLYYVVQREACGLLDTATILAEMRVPPEVHLRMGVRGPHRRQQG